jgi:hypothetical protein
MQTLIDGFEARECATLGVYWRDIYKDGELWACQVSAEVADAFVADPRSYGNAHAPAPILRRDALEADHALLALIGSEREVSIADAH